MVNLELVVDNKYREFYSGMEKDELVGYCNIHCETEIALFSREMVAQMIEYARCPKDFPKPEEIMKGKEWLSLHESMKNLVELVGSEQT